MLIAIPYNKGEYLDFWKIVKIPNDLYMQVVDRCVDVVKLDGVVDKEGFLKYWKQMLREKKRDIDKFDKAKASLRVIGAQKQFQKAMYKQMFEKTIGTTVL